jgi:flavin reductase (DIM6/NTAB) family NADH-FMN oxidoreductase RutF
MHKTIEPTTLYVGTPVALISTLNRDGSPNLAPMSSAWRLGCSCMLGLGTMGQTSENLMRIRHSANSSWIRKENKGGSFL